MKLTREQRMEVLLRQICDDETHSAEFACKRLGPEACGRCVAIDNARALLASKPKPRKHRK